MEHESDQLLSKDGLALFYQSWLLPNPDKVVCLIHGHGEHSGRYQHVAAFFANHNIATFSMDLRGHGLSKGKRGHARSYEYLIGDIEELLKVARAEYTEQPLILFGHSLGGNLVANYMLSMDVNELAGFVLSSPWFNTYEEPPKTKLRLAKIMNRIWPSYTESTDLDPVKISKIPEVVQAYINDPLVHSRLSAGLFTAITSMGAYALEHAPENKKPGLVYHGTADKLIDWKSSQIFAERSSLLEWHAWEGVYHEPHNDVEQQPVLELVVNWLNKLK